jgi:hypothetical protein
VGAEDSSLGALAVLPLLLGLGIRAGRRRNALTRGAQPRDRERAR